jgi:hypothetical protein
VAGDDDMAPSPESPQSSSRIMRAPSPAGSAATLVEQAHS